MAKSESAKTSIPIAILNALSAQLPKHHKTIELHEPLFGGNEWKMVKKCIDTGMVSSVGKYVDEFERRLTDLTGVRHATAVVNGTAALHMALKITGVGMNDEVLVPAITFVAVPNSVSYCNAIPHFVDSETQTFGVDPEKLHAYLSKIVVKRSGVCINKKTGRKIVALIAVHVFGHPARIDKLHAVCEHFGIKLIEDAAEALGSYYRGRHVGNHGIVTCLSFNGNKTITTGGGGAILTNIKKLAKTAKHLTTTARIAHRWEYSHNYIGYNYRLPNINAALGCAQLQELPSFLRRKRKLAERYMHAFRDISGVHLVKEPAHSKSNYWLNALLLDEPYSNLRDQILALTHQYGIKTRPIWKLMNKLPFYKKSPRMDLSMAESLENRTINIPSSAFL